MNVISYALNVDIYTPHLLQFEGKILWLHIANRLGRKNTAKPEYLCLFSES